VQIKAAAVLVYTDPAAMGLFFMGAIVLFEKSQRVIEPLSVSPASIDEYILSKALSISFVSLISSWAITLSLELTDVRFFAHSASGLGHFIVFSAALVLSSFLFTFAALICASRSKTINQFMIFTLPFEILLMVPPIIFVFGFSLPVMEVMPGILALRLFLRTDFFHPSVSLIMIAAWCALLYFFARKAVSAMFFRQEGIKL
jgi:fluoroquinolone transport system permease protein